METSENIKNSEDNLELSTEYDSTIQPNEISDLDGLSENELLKILNDIKSDSSILSKENTLYKYILKEDKSFLDMLEAVETETSDARGNILTDDEKCYLAKKQLANLEEDLKKQNSINTNELRELKFKLESLDLSLKTLKEAIEYFNKNVLERHLTTKKFILQKIDKYFDESIKNKRAMANRYKIQIESFTMECNKVMSQMKDQNKRLASLDTVKFQEFKYKHQRTSETLAKQKEILVIRKSKYSELVNKALEMKKSLKEEEKKLSKINEALAKKDHLKSVMWSEISYNDQKVEKLNEAMRKIKLDPRRHGLPEVIHYAAVKRQNENLKQNIKLWQKKVAVAEQAKLMHLKALKKKRLSSRHS